MDVCRLRIDNQSGDWIHARPIQRANLAADFVFSASGRRAACGARLQRPLRARARSRNAGGLVWFRTLGKTPRTHHTEGANCTTPRHQAAPPAAADASRPARLVRGRLHGPLCRRRLRPAELGLRARDVAQQRGVAAGRRLELAQHVAQPELDQLVAAVGSGCGWFAGSFFGGGNGAFPGGGKGTRAGSGGVGSLYGDGDAVVALDPLSFPAGGSDKGWLWLVEFYAPWCGHCQQLAPKWKKVAASLKGVARVGAVNCDEHKALCSERGVRGYLTIMALPPHSSRWQEYSSGDRSAGSLSSWATGLIGSEVAHLGAASDVERLMARCGRGGGGGRSKPGSAAAWGLCLVLLSDKAAVPSLWAALSVAFKGKVVFGFVGPESAEAAAALGAAAGGPAGGGKSRVVSVCNGDVRTAEAYSGACA